MLVESILSVKGADIVSVSPDSTVSDAATLLAEKKIGAVMVLTAEGNMAGILSERDIVRGLAAEGQDLLDKPVSDLMTTNLITCASSDNLIQILVQMTQKRIRHLPVVDDGNLEGMISIGDVVKGRLEELESEADSLRGYVAGGY